MHFLYDKLLTSILKAHIFLKNVDFVNEITEVAVLRIFFNKIKTFHKYLLLFLIAYFCFKFLLFIIRRTISKIKTYSLNLRHYNTSNSQNIKNNGRNSFSLRGTTFITTRYNLYI